MAPSWLPTSKHLRIEESMEEVTREHLRIEELVDRLRIKVLFGFATFHLAVVGIGLSLWMKACT
jgi:hypothetical protein